MKLKAKLLDEKAVKRSLIRISHEIIERNEGVENVVLIGIKRRGYPIAERISEEIKKIEGVEVPVGSVDITFYRDDLSTKAEMPKVQGIHIGVDIQDKIVILVDDVLFTCRTVRAAIDALIDAGRPAAVQLAVLIDRGHKELPIRADYVGKNIPTSKTEKIAVHIREVDNDDDSVKIYEN